MRGFLTWVSGAAFAFFVTAGAFLLLANLGTGPSETELPSRPEARGSGPALGLTVQRDGLASLDSAPDQSLAFDLRNEGERELTDINLTLKVFPEDTSVTDARYYKATVERLAGGETATADFNVVDLSPLPSGLDTRRQPEPPRWIVEARATTPGGASAVRTVILPRPSS
jgi:hypothetical protein